ncbi:MAG: hypothetical protein ABUT20_34240, partial [Bacteroidota bacterium]
KKYNYFLLMARMEPENNIEMILDGYCLTTLQKKFIVIGNTGNGYGKYLVNKYKDEHRIVFYGAIFDEEKVQSLTAFCSLYFHGHSVGGTNPSLLDAMATKVPLAAHHNAFNKSILKSNAVFFSNANDVCNLIHSNQYADEAHISNNYATIENEFAWDMIIDQYENYFLECYAAVHQYYPIKKHEKNILYKGQY